MDQWVIQRTNLSEIDLQLWSNETELKLLREFKVINVSVIIIITPSCISLSTWVRFTDPWSGHSSVTPWIGGWSSGGCCHSNCQGNTGKGTDDCLNWRVLDERKGPLYNHGSASQDPRDKKKKTIWDGGAAIPKCLQITGDLSDWPTRSVRLHKFWQFYLKSHRIWTLAVWCAGLAGWSVDLETVENTVWIPHRTIAVALYFRSLFQYPFYGVRFFFPHSWH